jgi:predicted acetyltransferase
MMSDMESFVLEQPSSEHEKRYEEMMDEWEAHQSQHGGWFNPGALRRYSNSQKRTATYPEWFKWIDDDRKAGQELYFFMHGEKILGAISIRPKKNAQSVGIDGHCGFGIRPSERRKGYATKMLHMVLPIMKERGINPLVITCDKENIGSAKVILNNGGVLMDEVMGEKSEKPVQIYHIGL